MAPRGSAINTGNYSDQQRRAATRASGTVPGSSADAATGAPSPGAMMYSHEVGGLFLGLEGGANKLPWGSWP